VNDVKLPRNRRRETTMAHNLRPLVLCIYLGRDAGGAAEGKYSEKRSLVDAV